MRRTKCLFTIDVVHKPSRQKKDQASYELDLPHDLLFETNLSHNVLVFVLELYDTI